MASTSKKPRRSVLPVYLDLYGVTEVNGSCICVVCQKTIPNESIKPNKLERHMKTHAKFASLDGDARKRAFHKCNQQYQKSVHVLTGALSENDRIAIFTYKTAFLAAKSNRPFVEGEVIIKPSLKLFAEIFEDQPFGKKLKSIANSIPMSNDTMQRRTAECAADISEQVISDFKSSPAKSLALDESTDITSNPQLAIYGRFIKNSEVKEELLTFETLDLTTKGQDVYDKVNGFLVRCGISWEDIGEVNVDGAPAMFGKHVGLRGLLNTLHPNVTVNHCIIHRQALAAKDLSEPFDNVMKITVTCINFIKARDLNSRMFRKLCEDMDAEFTTLLSYNAVRWLSRGKSLKRVFILREEMRDFLRSKDHQHAEDFNSPHFLARLALLTDVFEHLNFLNTNMQGRNVFVFDLHRNIRAFINKIDVMLLQVGEDDFNSFPCYREYQATADLDFGEVDYTLVKDSLVQYLQSLRNNFQERFPGLSENFDAIVGPFRVKPAEHRDVALELAELQADHAAQLEWADGDVSKFWLTRDRYPKLKQMAVRVLSRFGTTYVCESAFSAMAFIKNKHRSRMSNDNLLSCMVCSTTTYEPRYRELVTKK